MDIIGPKIDSRRLSRVNMAEGAVRYRNAVLIDDEQQRHLGDFLLHSDGSWSNSNGDEDVIQDIDGSKRLITRSMQNWHTHLAMQLNARDFSDGLALEQWLEKSIFPTEMRLTPDICAAGTAAAAAEMIKTGSTFACDMYHFPAAIAPVMADAGLRAIICGPQTQWPPNAEGDDGEVRKELESLIASNKPENKVQYGVATHAIYTCDKETLLKGKELAEKYDAALHIHVSETRKEVAQCFDEHGMYPVEYLDSIDYFLPGTICAHGSWVKKSEMRTLAKVGAKVVHCPTSNMKLACGGTLSLPAYLEAGVDVRLGTDGGASSGSGLDLVNEARMASLVQRHDHWDASALTAEAAFAMATKGSQDWAVWNLDDIRMAPYGRSNNRHIANLIYNGAECLDLWVDGEALRQNGETKTMDESKVLDNLNDAVETYYQNLE